MINDDVGCFAEGLCKVKIGDKWGFIDKTNKLIVVWQVLLTNE